jgi:hypothetical protein
MSRIPHRVMQTWKTTELPPQWQPSQDAVRRYLPDWEYTLLTDEANRELVAQHFPDFLPYYDGFPHPIQRADAIRYCWLYLYGGLYLDCDIELVGDITSLFATGEELYLLPSSNRPAVLTNAFMASVPRHPLWLALIEEMKQPAGWRSLEKHLHVMHSTGPLALTRVVQREGYPYGELPAPLLSPCSLCEPNCEAPTALARALPGSSWVGWWGKIGQWFFCYPKVADGGVVAVVVLLWFWWNSRRGTDTSLISLD